ncbi:ABC-2 type transport system ATP-binding protein [Planifilum fulgidum]|jgi:ABC-2 type transport system ATP-binding protein|uniref:ABC-2 type transport system ATP-binding protein n=1 Tax=Planifilum fulgidum TaxID=201973 RepID=A0A1I2QCL7_9BACL|nr:ABC transporter ATP-binding protein [Planifilum fulgidum]SFG26132.1 ABC-2 type transport system ATP-binding protein [Planifilum fulgidum]
MTQTLEMPSSPRTETVPSDKEVVIDCQDVSKHFYEPVEGSRSWRNLFLGERRLIRAVNQVSFRVYRGEIFGLLGSNGSGKSTMIRLIATLLFPDEGKLTVFGKDVVRHQHEVRRRINRVSVEASFFKKLSSVENLRYTARLYGLSAEEGERRALKILRRLGISERKSRVPLENLSRGMQQKVAIARALMTDPELVLLDEPTTGLDPKSKRDVQEFLLEVKKSGQTTMILTSHDMDEAEKLCDRIAIISKGSLIALDTPEGLKRQTGASTMEEVFFRCTGMEWEDALADEDDE